MNLKEAFDKFDTSDTVSILVNTKQGMRALSGVNMMGGVCGCCQEVDARDDLEVLRVVDLATMEVFFDSKDGIIS
jgi:hypothetical protein